MLSKSQLSAVERIVSSTANEIALTGGPGTGKSTLIQEIAARLPGSRVVATTHKAAQLLGPEVTTLHSALGATHRTRMGATRKFSALIIDEASMVSSDMYADLQRLPCRKIYVLDPDQLPPVNESISPVCHVSPQIRLTAYFRQDNAGLLDIVQRVRSMARSGDTDVSWIRKRATDFLPGDRYIAYRNKTVEALNAGKMTEGAPVEFHESVMANCGAVTNGTQGVLVRDGVVRKVRLLDGRTAYVSQRVDVRPAFAITAHKAQGSTYDGVHIALNDIMSARQDALRLLYVAVSRARKRVSFMD